MSQAFSNDIIFKSFLRNNERFADMINAAVFQGMPMVDPERLRDVNTDLPVVLDSGGKKVMTIERFRDLVKMIDMGSYILVLGIENQKTTHPRMASRMLLYDAALIDAMSRKKPCIYISLVVYLGEKRWKAKTNVLDELKVPKQYRKGLNNWETHFIDLNRTDPGIFQHKDNQDVTKLIQALYNWDGHSMIFKGLNMTREVILAAVSATNSYEILAELKSLEETSLEGEDYMCQAVTNALKKAERKGEEKAMKKTDKIVRRARKEAARQAVYEARPAILLEGERNIFLHLISKNYIKKFGSLSEELKAKISEQTNENLEMILDAIPDLHNGQDIMQFLVN